MPAHPADMPQPVHVTLSGARSGQDTFCATHSYRSAEREVPLW